MGRSGTSLATRVVGLLGVNLGREASMLEAHPKDNARGYWELRPIMELNDEILAMFGGTWYDPPELPPGWEQDPRLTPLAKSAADVLHAEFPDGERWGWKDPRSSLTLPFWQRIVGPMDFILCFRNPLEVAASLNARFSDLHPIQGSLRLWMRYSAMSLQHTSGQRRLILHYEDWFVDPEQQLDRIASFLATSGSAPSDWERQACTLLEHDLRHHRRDAGDVLGDEVPAEVGAFYTLLRAGALDQGQETLLIRLAAALDARVRAEHSAEHAGRRVAGLASQLGAERAAREEVEADLSRHRRWLEDTQASISWRATQPLRAARSTAGRLVATRMARRDERR